MFYLDLIVSGAGNEESGPYVATMEFWHEYEFSGCATFRAAMRALYAGNYNR